MITLEDKINYNFSYSILKQLLNENYINETQFKKAVKEIDKIYLGENNDY